MKKEEFLKKLEDSLNRLDENDRKKVLSKYKATFTRKMKEGFKEEEIIEEFGNYNDLINKIYSDYGIATIAQESAHTIADFFREFLQVVEDIVNYIAKQDIKDVLILICKIIVTLILISCLKLPILFIRDLGSGLLDLLFSPLSTILIFCWRFILEIIYIIIAITLFVKVFNIIIKPRNKKKQTHNKNKK